MLVGIRDIEPTPVLYNELPPLLIDGVQINRTVSNYDLPRWSGKLVMNYESARESMAFDWRLNLGFMSSRISGYGIIKNITLSIPQPAHQQLVATVEFDGTGELLIDGKNGFGVEFADGGRLEFPQMEDRDDG